MDCDPEDVRRKARAGAGSISPGAAVETIMAHGTVRFPASSAETSQNAWFGLGGGRVGLRSSGKVIDLLPFQEYILLTVF